MSVRIRFSEKDVEDEDEEDKKEEEEKKEMMTTICRDCKTQAHVYHLSVQRVTDLTSNRVGLDWANHDDDDDNGDDDDNDDDNNDDDDNDDQQ